MTTTKRLRAAALATLALLGATACNPDPVSEAPGEETPSAPLTITTRIVHAPPTSSSIDTVLGVDGATGPVTWSVDPTTPLPTWLTLGTDGTLSGSNDGTVSGLSEAFVVHASDGTSTTSAYVQFVQTPLLEDPLLDAAPQPLPEGSLISALVTAPPTAGIVGVRPDGEVTPLTLGELAAEQLRIRSGRQSEYAVGFNPPGNVRHLPDGALVMTPSVPQPAGITAALMSPDGEHLAVGAVTSNSSIVHLFEVSTGELVRTAGFPSSTTGGVTFAWKADSSAVLAVGSSLPDNPNPVIEVNTDPAVATVSHQLPGIACAAIGWAVTGDALIRCDGDIVAISPAGNVSPLLESIPSGGVKPSGSLCTIGQHQTFHTGPTSYEAQAALSPSSRYLAVVDACITPGQPNPTTVRIVYVDLLEPGGPSTLVPLAVDTSGSLAFVSLFSWT